MPHASEIRSKNVYSLDQHLGNIRRLEEELEVVRGEEQMIITRRMRLEEVLQQERSRVLALQEDRLVWTPLSAQVRGLRIQFTNLREKVLSPDTTKKDASIVEEGAWAVLDLLQKTCTHQFVVSFDGYAGSTGMDHDDAFCGNRMCLVCGFEETSEICGEDVYKTLVSDDTRLVKRDIRKKAPREKYGNVFSGPFSLEASSAAPLPSMAEVRKLFLEAAGKQNIE